MAYTYYISFDNATWNQFYPVSRNKITWETEANEVFKRPKIDEIKIDERRNPSVYSAIETRFNDTSEFGNYVYFKLKRGTVDTFYFVCSVNDGKADVQNKVFYFTPRPNDSYEKILMQYDKKYQGRLSDILGGSFNVPMLDTTNAFINVDFTAFADASGSVTWSNAGSSTQYARKQLSASQPANNIVYVLIKNLVNNVGGPGSRPRLTLTTVTGTAHSNVVTLTGNGRYVLTSTSASAAYVEIKQLGSGGGDNGSFNYEIYRPIARNNGKILEQVLIDLLGASYMDTGLTPKSTILFNDALPTIKPPNINTYMTTNPNNDYVIRAAAIWNNIVLANTDSLTTAKKDFHEISFREVSDILKKKLRIFWYIDSDGFVRFEHEKYFNDFAVQIDLTSSTYSAYKPETDRVIYNFQKADIYSQIMYKESNESTADWVAHPVDYDLIKTGPATIQVSPPNLSTDVPYIADNPDDADNSGFMLLQCVLMGTSPLVDISESVLTPGTFYRNARLSWAWLIANYFTFFGDADEATINGGTTLSLDSVKPFKKQSGVKFYHDGILSWIHPVTMRGGKAWLDKIELDLDTGYYNIDVGFDPY